LSQVGQDSLAVGDRVTIDVGAVAHGGHCVARHNGQVIFVRHTLPGERVVAQITEVGSGSKFLRADAIEVIDASAGRIASACTYAHPGGCGGCDWQHVSQAVQRELKSAVISEQMSRLAGLEISVEVEQVTGAPDGLGWRTRVGYSVDGSGKVGFHRHRSSEVEPIDRCLLATTEVQQLPVTERNWNGVESVVAVVSSTGDRALALTPIPQSATAKRAVADLDSDIAIHGVRGASRVTERAANRDWKVGIDGFWQVHPGAADLLVDVVRSMLEPKAGDHLIDLYSGVGLLGGALAGELGAGGRVECVESDATACSAARRNLHDVETVRVHQEEVRTWLTRSAPRRCDLVVLDPPRTGAGKAVLERLVKLSPRAIVYVACDPAALARDTATLTNLNWSMTALRAFDLFPMTHHMECVALFTPHDQA